LIRKRRRSTDHLESFRNTVHSIFFKIDSIFFNDLNIYPQSHTIRPCCTNIEVTFMNNTACVVLIFDDRLHSIPIRLFSTAQNLYLELLNDMPRVYFSASFRLAKLLFYKNKAVEFAERFIKIKSLTLTAISAISNKRRFRYQTGAIVGFKALLNLKINGNQWVIRVNLM